MLTLSTRVLLSLLLALNTGQAIAGGSCANRPEVVGACFEIRGRMQIYNGSMNLRIWPVGTKRLLFVEQNAEERFNVPTDLEPSIQMGTLIYGNYLVCPLAPERASHMRKVCVAKAKDLRFQR